MKNLFFIFCFLASSAVLAQSSGSQYDALVAQDDMKVDCSNILKVVLSYIDLNEQNSRLMHVSGNRFLSTVSFPVAGDGVKGEMKGKDKICKDKTLQEDIQETVFLIGENQNILFNKAGDIREVLPGCLSSVQQ